VLVYAGPFLTAYTVPGDFHNLWLGQATGKVVYLTDEPQLGERALLEKGREVAQRLGARM
jgi:hypothetical protein